MNDTGAFEYENEHWPTLKFALQALFQAPEKESLISFEKCYDCVNKCVQNNYTSRLLKDLYQEIESIMDQLSRDLQEKKHVDLVTTFVATLRRFHCASERVLEIFKFLCREKPDLEEEMKSKLASIFTSQVVILHLTRVFAILETSQRTLLMVPPDVMSQLVLDLQKLKPEYATIVPSLFDKFVPNLPPRPTYRSPMDAFEYENMHWPSLKCALRERFTQVPWDKLEMSFEKSYLCVYKCACNNYTSRLFKDVYHEIESIMDQLSRDLQEKEHVDLVTAFAATLHRFHYALERVLDIFKFLWCDDETPQPHLEEEMKSKLASMFMSQVVDLHLTRVFATLETAKGTPYPVPPDVMSQLVLDLHKLKPEYATTARSLFDQFLPNLLTSATVSGEANSSNKLVNEEES